MLEGKLRVLVVGGGAREHVLFDQILKSPFVEYATITPGNGGIEDEHRFEASVHDFERIFAIVEQFDIHLVVVGPEAPVAVGIVDQFRHRFGERRRIFGPTMGAARLESDKAFMAQIAEHLGIPRPRTMIHKSPAHPAEVTIREWGVPIVIKDPTLQAGKGVTVAFTIDEALQATRALESEGKPVVVEEFLDGYELSSMWLCDGTPENAMPFALAQDCKQLNDGGPMTGGMGAYSPVPFAPARLVDEVGEHCIRPTLRYMQARGTPFQGILYAGLMVTSEGPKLLEHNVRFGDPEAQAILPRLASDIVPYLWLASTYGGLKDVAPPTFKSLACVATVLAECNYPISGGEPFTIHGLDTINGATRVYHAGTRQGAGGSFVAERGRVLTVSTLGLSLPIARRMNARAIAKVSTEPRGRLIHRDDIGANADPDLQDVC